MITEDYCSYDVAKLLTEKGFREYCEAIYFILEDEDYSWSKIDIPIRDCSICKPAAILCPTHQMAMKWLREVHRKYIDIRYNTQNEKYRFIVFTMVKDKPIDFIHSEFYSTYEETTEAALFYVLENLI